MKIDKGKSVWLLLAVTLVAAYFAPAPDSDAMLSVPQDRGGDVDAVEEVVQSQAHSDASEPDVLEIRPRTEAATPEGMFSATSWSGSRPMEPEPVRDEASDAPVVESAPPIPFSVIGRYMEGGKVAVFVQYNNESLAVRVGDKIGGLYRVEEISEGAMSVLYMPLNEVQSISTAGGG